MHEKVSAGRWELALDMGQMQVRVEDVQLLEAMRQHLVRETTLLKDCQRLRRLPSPGNDIDRARSKR